MTSESAIAPDLVEAYKATDFRVHTQPPIVLKIGVASPQLAQLYSQHGTTCAAFLTAYNPYSEAVGDAENSAFQHKLSSELTSRGLAIIQGMGQDSLGQWPGEPSFLILGLALDDAKLMGAQYRQNALVWCGEDAVPHLILLR
jgi:hypothetical protein